MNKKILISLIIIILVAVGILVWFFWLKPEVPGPIVEEEPSFQEKPSCFDSTKDPIPICNCQDLQRMKENLVANYQLQDDIDCLDTKNWNKGKGFEPISKDDDPNTPGFQGDAFTGTFDGQNYTINNLYINRPDESFIGLFGYIFCQKNDLSRDFCPTGGKISNVGLRNINMSGYDSVGGFTGFLQGGTAINSFTDGIVSGNNDVGGLVGINKGFGIIMNSFSAANIFNSGNDTGGIVGDNQGYVIACFAKGTISGKKGVGGLVGENDGLDDEGNKWVAAVEDCYSTGNVTGDENVGGLVGDNDVGIITNSYATGTVSGNKDVGGLVGDNHTGIIKNSFAAGMVVGGDRVGGLNGVNHGGVITNSYFGRPANSSVECVGRTKDGGQSDCNIIESNENYFYWLDRKPMNLWSIPPWSKKNEGNGYPVLDWQEFTPAPPPPTTPPPTTPPPTTPPTTTPPPETPLPTSTFPTPPVTPTPTSSCFDTTTTPILVCDCQQLQRIKENLTADYKLQNNIDCSDTRNWNNGKGFEPIAFDTNSSLIEFQGTKFTGKLDGQGYKITNLYINRPKEDFLGLFGFSKGEISNVGLENINISSNDDVGGLVGNNEGTIQNSYSTGTITGDEDTGGLVGENLGSGIITNCYSTVTISKAGKDVGGLVGENEGGTITDSYATGNVFGDDNVGGLVGDNKGQIKNSFATGIITAPNDVGGLVGRNSASITNCFWNKPAGSSLSCVGDNKATGSVDCSVINNNKSYFYSLANKPINSWNFPPWSKENDGKNYPVLE